MAGGRGNTVLCVPVQQNVREREEKEAKIKKGKEEERRDIPDVVRALLELRGSRTTSEIAGEASSRTGGGGRSRGRTGGGSHTNNVVSALTAHVGTGT